MWKYQVEGLTTTFTILLLLICATATKTASMGEPRTAAVFGFELIDTSAEGSLYGKRADETQRLALLSKILRDRLAASGHYSIVDLGSQADAIKNASPLFSCNDCAGEFVTKAGADVGFTGYVQKVSNLILNINVEMWDGKTGKKFKVWSADIRGNTDESWTRGLNWLLDHRVLAAEPPPR